MIPAPKTCRRIALTAVVAATGLCGCWRRDLGGVPGLSGMFGSTGMGPGEFSCPRAAALAPGQCLYVVDKAARIQCFTPEGAYLREWSTPAHAAGKPTGLGIGPDGRIYVADTHYSRVLVYQPDGTLVARFGTRGEGPGQFLLPTDVAVDEQGTIYVSEYGGNDRISRFSPDLEYLSSFGRPGAGDGEFQRPQSLLLAGDGTLWVADSCNHRICHYTRTGEFLGSFGHNGKGPGELRFPYDLDLLSDGTLVVCEYGNNRLQRFDQGGRPLGVWGEAGRRPGQLFAPWAVVVGKDDLLFAVDSGNNRIQIALGGVSRTWR